MYEHIFGVMTAPDSVKGIVCNAQQYCSILSLPAVQSFSVIDIQLITDIGRVPILGYLY